MEQVDALTDYFERLEAESRTLAPERMNVLDSIVEFIRSMHENGEPAELLFVCTHNSRRSIMAQVLAQAIANKMELHGVHSYSGGVESTQVNSHAAAALTEAGLHIQNDASRSGVFTWEMDGKSIPLFSKRYDHSANPIVDFAAIMVCSDASENCPYIPGNQTRISLTYEDPRESDGTGDEPIVYGDRCFQIGAEMMYVMSKVKG